MIRVERRIDASRDAVWRYLGDLRAWGRLLPTFAEVEPLDERPTGAGSRFASPNPVWRRRSTW
ncbi:SRPBCC family protein [Tamaricihabitans halophyticus]|uniref:SRPBCC family protein n=1 Tax=Tamaricihabitans halophyticus TaxID=1262583 RepID=UPI0010438DD5|nr:SRPBCC family protein [Tamaricihabitans halophyticus]